MVARLQSNNEPGGSRLAAQLANPSAVIRRFVVRRNLPGVPVMSVGMHQGMVPFQNLAICVLGVAPLLISATSPRDFVFHFSLNPGRRVLPVRSCCIAPCLMARFLAISASNAASD